jgi:hypothetical protein
MVSRSGRQATPAGGSGLYADEWRTNDELASTFVIVVAKMRDI